MQVYQRAIRKFSSEFCAGVPANAFQRTELERALESGIAELADLRR